MEVGASSLIVAALFGAIIGSFLNALLYRFNTGLSIARGRSRCMRCGHTLTFFDLMPIISYLGLRGRCRHCGTRISIQYPLIEGIAALVSVATLLTAPTPLLYVLWFCTWMTLLFILVYDLRHMVIPWSASGTLAALSLVILFLGSGSFVIPGIWALMAGPLCALPLFLISLFSGGRAMGWGDGIVMLPLGWLLGLSAGASALMMAFWIGAILGLLLMLFQFLGWKGVRSRLTMSSEIPFAPFLVLGAGIAYFLHVDFFSNLPLLF
jgi:leader peptidase (prepilin peptidase)/N-methyltransferase